MGDRWTVTGRARADRALWPRSGDYQIIRDPQ